MAGSKTILFIEDDHFISEMYVQSLTKSGYQVDSCNSGDRALEMLADNDYDLILLDIFLPIITGTEIVDEIDKRQLLKPSTKIVIVTNYMQDETARSQLEAKVDGYLIKANVTPSKLVEYVDQLLEG